MVSTAKLSRQAGQGHACCSHTCACIQINGLVSSNDALSWCPQHIADAVLRHCAPLLFAHPLPDALVPQQYIQQLEAVSAAQPIPAGNMYAGPVLFEQDNSGIPAIVRVTDYMWSAMAMQNLNSWTGIGFPISNYRWALGAVPRCGRQQPEAPLHTLATRWPGNSSCHTPAPACHRHGRCILKLQLRHDHPALSMTPLPASCACCLLLLPAASPWPWLRRWTTGMPSLMPLARTCTCSSRCSCALAAVPAWCRCTSPSTCATSAATTRSRRCMRATCRWVARGQGAVWWRPAGIQV
jgi:hypothetical protein